MNNLRLVILDYPKLHIQNHEVKKVLADMIQAKQINFERTDKNYVSLNSQDMISTHYMIFDTKSLYTPHPIFSIRTCYRNRSKTHNLSLPVEDCLNPLSVEFQAHYQKFVESKTDVVDCNAWFVDPSWTQKNSNLKISEIGYFMVFSYLLKQGYDHILGVTNETYKASRWLEPVGDFRKDLIFNHPLIGTPHMFIIIEKINYQWLSNSLDIYEELYDNRLELRTPLSSDPTMSDEELKQMIRSRGKETVIELGRVTDKPIAS